MASHTALRSREGGGGSVPGVRGRSLAGHTGATTWLFSMAAALFCLHLSNPFTDRVRSCEPQTMFLLVLPRNGRQGLRVPSWGHRLPWISLHLCFPGTHGPGALAPLPLGHHHYPGLLRARPPHGCLGPQSPPLSSVSTRREPRPDHGSHLLICFKNMYLIYTQSLVRSA